MKVGEEGGEGYTVLVLPFFHPQQSFNVPLNTHTYTQINKQTKSTIMELCFLELRFFLYLQHMFTSASCMYALCIYLYVCRKGYRFIHAVIPAFRHSYTAVVYSLTSSCFPPRTHFSTSMSSLLDLLHLN